MSDTDRQGQTPEMGQNTNATSTLSVSKQCELLASRRRRVILRYLTARPSELVNIDELADFLLTHGEGSERQNIMHSLHHVHVPKLADAGVITYHREQHQLTYQGGRKLEELLDFLDNRD